MKATELMIGDYLRINRDRLCIKKGTIVEVRDIDANASFKNLIGCATCRPLDDMQYEGGIWCDYLKPIPITKEILEKNGFRKEEEPRGFSEPYCVYINDNFQYPIKVYPKEGMDRYSRLEIGEYDDCEYMSLLINHVHELQHALRQCGIEKEITI